jgi:hypothetical protein
MGFTGYSIFPGFRVIGAVSEAVRELAFVFNLEAINALQTQPEESLGWADIAGVTPASIVAKIPLDLTALDGFEEFKGTRNYKNIDVTAIEVDVNQWTRNVQWDERLASGSPEALVNALNLSNVAANLIMNARRMKARIAASVFLKGTPTANLAKVYAGANIPGAGLSLFNTAHYVNPMDPTSGTFKNYYADFGPFDARSFAYTLLNMTEIDSPTGQAETLGLQVTDVIGGPQMREAFRRVALADLILQTTANTGSTGLVAAAPTNIYASGTTPCRFWIAPQLKNDPAYANGGHMWIAVSRTIPGMRPIEMAAPTKEFTPKLQLWGDGSELCMQTKKITLTADLDAGAAAGLPHCVARYESGTGASAPTVNP